MIMWSQDIGDIQGRVLTILESLGLPATQEKAAKDLLRKAIWENIYTEWRCFIPFRDVQVIAEKYKNNKKSKK